jgi:hypothetical protein
MNDRVGKIFVCIALNIISNEAAHVLYGIFRKAGNQSYQV